jgi:hypothetical protein
MSLLTIVQTVTAELSLVQPTMVVGSADRQVQQLLALANRAGMKLAKAYPWEAMREEVVFPTLNQVTQTAIIPADFSRFVDNSFFNRTTRRPITGPITPRQWQWIQAQPVFSTAYLMFNQRQGLFNMAPVPPAGQQIAFEYISKYWAQSAAGAAQASFLADTDTSFLDEDLLTMGLKWRYLRSKGLDYAEEMADYEDELETAKARDGGATTLTLAPQPIDPNRANIPDGNFGI